MFAMPPADTDLAAKNANLVTMLERAKATIVSQQEEIAQLSEVPNAFGTYIGPAGEGHVDIFSGGRRMRVATTVPVNGLAAGQQVLITETGAVLSAEGYEDRGQVVRVIEHRPEGRVLVSTGGGDEQGLVWLAGAAAKAKLRTGDSLLADLRAGYAYEVVDVDETADLLLETVPDITYNDIGGMAAQIEEIQDAIELPYLHPDLFDRYELRAPRGVLLYGPPGCGKTLVAKAVANSLAKRAGADKAYFINVKGPELLSKWVGETEATIRMIFERAREKASEGFPVIIFFDEMESMFRTRGSGVSSDIESTLVPQLLAEIDGVEELGNVVVMGASNRQDLIDPAVLRPGRLDVKIAVQRPDRDGARDIFSKYLTKNLPYERVSYKGSLVKRLINDTVDELFAETKDTEFLEVTYANGARDTMHFKDFVSGAMIENIVSRAKKAAVKGELAGEPSGITSVHLTKAVADEFRETEDLPNTTNPDDWAKISGKKGERIVNVRNILRPDEAVVETVAGGQYL